MRTLLQDLRYAARALRASPGFTLVAALTLALGVGANTAIFSVVHAVLLRPLPFAEPDRLVRAFTVNDGIPGSMSPPDFLDFRAQNHVFQGLAAYDALDFTLTALGEPARLPGVSVTSGFFETLGVRPLLGRTFRAEESRPDRSRVVLLSHALWRQRFGGDPGVLGRTVTLDGRSYTVVGVMPPGFDYPARRELWTPIPEDEDFTSEENRRGEYLAVIGRLRPGATLDQAAADLAALAGRLAREHPETNTAIGASVASLEEHLVRDVRRPLLVLLGAVAFVLLVACANVANLLLVRASARESELAVRAALGAGRLRLLRQLLTESLLLGTIGGGVGLLLASWGAAALVRLAPPGIPRVEGVGMDGPVVVFALGVALLTALLFGTVPALQSTRPALAATLKEGGRGALGARHGARTRGLLVVAETALAVVLLVGAGLLLKSFVRLLEVDPGFRFERRLAFELQLPDSDYGDDARKDAFYRSLLERLDALPGVLSAGAVTGLPLSGTNFLISFDVEGRPPARPGQSVAMQVRIATPEYFETMGIPLRRGRLFSDADRAAAPQVVLLSEPAVRRFFPGEDPLGKRIDLGWTRGHSETRVGGEVVGIVGGVKQGGLADPFEPEIYVPHAQVPLGWLSVVLRVDGDPRGLAAAVVREVRALDPNLPVAEVKTLDDVVSQAVARPRFYLSLLALFAAIALALAAVGIFGVLSYTVAQRRREIGIRMALGAEPAAVLRSVMTGALLLAAGGLALGLLGALALTRAIRSLLFGVSAADPSTFLAVAATLAAAAALASWLPARSATRVDPASALRAE
jgi:predicted permease